MKKISGCLLMCCSLILAACFDNPFEDNPAPTQVDTSITEQTSFNSNFFDSTQLQSFLAKNSFLQKYKNQYADFYKLRNYQYAWFDENGLDEQAKNLMNLVGESVYNLHDSSIFIKNFIKTANNLVVKTKEEISDQETLNAELLFTGQFFNYAQKVYKGIDVNAEELGWFIPRKKVDITQLLDTVLKSKESNIENYIPFNTQYYKLQQQLELHYAIKKQFKRWDTLSLSKPFKLGDSSNYIKRIKKQFFSLGDMSVEDTSTKKCTNNLIKAIKSFQKRYDIPVTGTLSAKTVAEFNVPIKQRIEQILINLERARWLPAEKDSNYIIVNIPEYKLHVYDSAKNTWDMNVIVGKAANNTVIFSGNLKYIVFSPYWNVPKSIVKKEIMPHLKYGNWYLQKNNMEIYGKGDSFPLIRQKPGPMNSLGLVKFLFPNSHDIYLHDTPNKNLFSAKERSFSHGCIRLADPKKFAQYLLRDDTVRYKTKIVDSLMHLPKEKWVTLKKSIPVYLVYFTSWVDKNGKLNFRKDIYNHDEKMAEKLFNRPPAINNMSKKDSVLVKPKGIPVKKALP